MRALASGFVLVSIAACGDNLVRPGSPPDAPRFTTPDASIFAACDPTHPFSAPIADGERTDETYEFPSRMSADELTAYASIIAGEVNGPARSTRRFARAWARPSKRPSR